MLSVIICLSTNSTFERCVLSKKFVKKWGKRGSNDLIDLMGKVSDDLSTNFEIANEDAQKILKDARARAHKNDKKT
jgi:hypothetical protein